MSLPPVPKRVTLTASNPTSPQMPGWQGKLATVFTVFLTQFTLATFFIQTVSTEEVQAL